MTLSLLERAFRRQLRDAARREIVFKLSFGEWYSIWLKSGHLSERGRKKGQYVMGRNGDKGAYEVGNVKIILCDQNNSDGNRDKHHEPKSRSHREKISQSLRGRPPSEETRKKISLANKGRKRGPMPEETKLKLSAATKGRSGQLFSDESRAKMGASQVQRWARWRAAQEKK